MKNLVFILLLAGLILFASCKKENRDKLKYASFSSVIDSVEMYPNPRSGRTHAILVDGTWYKLFANYYGTFIRYVEKGDSLFKEPGRYDIYVYKKKNGEYIEKYFRGAQWYWD